MVLASDSLRDHSLSAVLAIPTLRTMTLPTSQLSIDRPFRCQQTGHALASPLRTRTVQHFRQSPSRHGLRGQETCLPHATSEDSQSSSETVQHAEKTAGRMAQTLGNLDALLGIEEEKKEEQEEKTTQAKVCSLCLFSSHRCSQTLRRAPEFRKYVHHILQHPGQEASRPAHAHQHKSSHHPCRRPR